MGYDLCLQNSTGNNNTAVGNSALFSNTTGNNNTAKVIMPMNMVILIMQPLLDTMLFVDSGNKVQLWVMIM